MCFFILLNPRQFTIKSNNMLHELYKQKQIELNQLENTIFSQVEKLLTVDDSEKTGNDYIMAKSTKGCGDDGELIYDIYIQGVLTEEYVYGSDLYVTMAKYLGI